MRDGDCAGASRDVAGAVVAGGASGYRCVRGGGVGEFSSARVTACGVNAWCATPNRVHAKAFETWLKKNRAASGGLWLKIAKRGANGPSVTYPEAVEIALCWGWIDGQKKGLDDQHFLQRFTPRRARSIWSKINVDKAAALIAACRMQAPGYAQIETARADGRWAQAYDGARTSRGARGPVGGAGRRAEGQRLLCNDPRPIATRYCGAYRRP